MAIETQADLGRRIAEAREGAGRTQAELAALMGIDRTAIVRIEAGTRKVSATELVAIASALKRPIDWFVVESPPAVVSRRRDPAVGGFSRRLDLALEDAARDVAFLVERGILTDADQGAKAAKRHQAVSGYWHTQATLARWCRIRSYLDSATAHGLTALDSVSAALAGKPWLPPLPAGDLLAA